MLFSVCGDHVLVDRRHFCRCDTRLMVAPGTVVDLDVQFHPDTGEEQPYARGIGWVGAAEGSDILVGVVRGRTSVVGEPQTMRRIVSVLNRCIERGESCFLEFLDAESFA